MILRKNINNNDTIVIECKKDILCTSTTVVNKTVMLGFSEMGEEQDLDQILDVNEVNYKENPPKIFIEFHHLKSIDNLIDQLKQCRDGLSQELKEGMK